MWNYMCCCRGGVSKLTETGPSSVSKSLINVATATSEYFMVAICGYGSPAEAGGHTSDAQRSGPRRVDQPRAGRQTPELPQTRPALAQEIPAHNLTSSRLPSVYFGGTPALNQYDALARPDCKRHRT